MDTDERYDMIRKALTTALDALDRAEQDGKGVSMTMAFVADEGPAAGMMVISARIHANVEEGGQHDCTEASTLVKLLDADDLMKAQHLDNETEKNKDVLMN